MIKGNTKQELKEGETLLESYETSEGTFNLWKVDVDADKDGIPFESPRDIDVNGLDEDKLVRAMFPITKETHGKFIQTIEGSCTTSKREGFSVNLEKDPDYDPELERHAITFDNEEEVGFLIFNAKVQQIQNILYYRRIDWIYVSHIY